MVQLACSKCGERNYTTSRRKEGERLNLSKFCPRCRKHTKHKEIKIGK